MTTMDHDETRSEFASIRTMSKAEVDQHALEQDADFWMQLVSNFSVNSLPAQFTLETLMDMYDMTDDGLERVFRMLDSENRDGLLSPDEFRHGLKHIGLEVVKNDDFAAIFAKIDAEGSGEIDKVEFYRAMKRLKLAMVFRQGQLQKSVTVHIRKKSNRLSTSPTNGTSHLRVFEWSRGDTREIPVENTRLQQHFFFGHRNKQYPMRWVMLDQPDVVSMLKLSIKYAFHPMSTESLLMLSEQSAIVRDFDTHFMLIVPVLHLGLPKPATATGGQMLDRLQSFFKLSSSSNLHTTDSKALWMKLFDATPNGKYDVLVKQLVFSNLAIFVAGPPKFDTVITVQSEWNRLCTSYFDSTAPDENVARPSVPVLSPMITRLLSAHASYVRMGNSEWFAYNILAEVIKSYMKPLEIYRLLLDYLQVTLRTKYQLRSGDFKNLVVMKQDLYTYKRTLRPVQSIVTGLLIDTSGPTARLLQDIDDTLAYTLSDVAELDDMCEQLLAQYQQYKDARVGKILFILTITTAFCLPGQLMSGVFGMNFVDSDGNSSVPLMRDRDGFLVWLGIVLVSTALVVLFLWGLFKLTKAKGELRKPQMIKDREQALRKQADAKEAD